MFKAMHDPVWVFDVEWVPDPVVGRILHQLPQETPDTEVVQAMWQAGGADEENPMPFLKTALCRVVSIAAVARTKNPEGASLRLTSLPHDVTDTAQTDEAAILSRFLNAVGDKKPQLVGFNSQRADLKILVQRALANGVQASKFAERPNKPWEGIDYWDSGSDHNVDLMGILGGYGKATPSLNEMAAVCRIPGKLGVDGQEVAPLWLEGRWDEIVAYNECDALTTYLLWLRLAYFGGFFDEAQYSEEQDRVRTLLQTEGESGKTHLLEFLEEWERLLTEYLA
jgi:predicted PolB exonuclease-like 3'-5' exonuclease